MTTRTLDEVEAALRSERARRAATIGAQKVDPRARGRKAMMTNLVNTANMLDPDGLWPPDERMRRAKKAVDARLAANRQKARIKKLEAEAKRLKAGTS